MAATQEIIDWLGDFASTVSDEQIDAIAEAATTIEQRWPDPDDADTREQALSAAAQVILGGDTLENIAAA